MLFHITMAFKPLFPQVVAGCHSEVPPWVCHLQQCYPVQGVQLKYREWKGENKLQLTQSNLQTFYAEATASWASLVATRKTAWSRDCDPWAQHLPSSLFCIEQRAASSSGCVCNELNRLAAGWTAKNQTGCKTPLSEVIYQRCWHHAAFTATLTPCQLHRTKTFFALQRELHTISSTGFVPLSFKLRVLFSICDEVL